MTFTSRPEGCRIDILDHAASMAWLRFVLGRGDAPGALGDEAWILCHCDDGVTWGRIERAVLRLGCRVFPELCPVPSERTLQEMRVFTRGAEVLVWRAEEGLRGRILRDSTPPILDGPLAPSDEHHLLLGRRVIAEYRDGFTRVGDGAGAEHAIPLRLVEDPAVPWPRLAMRHYFARDERSGIVRVAATRLTEVW